jgi:hypothetical protein
MLAMPDPAKNTAKLANRTALPERPASHARYGVAGKNHKGRKYGQHRPNLAMKWSVDHGLSTLGNGGLEGVMTHG